MPPIQRRSAPRGPFLCTAPERILNHRIDTHEAFDRLAETISLPLTLKPISGDAPQLELRGLRMSRATVWTVRSATGFESTPRDGLDIYSIRIPLEGAVLRRTERQDYETVPGEATILDASEIVATRCHPGSHLLCCAVSGEALQVRLAGLDEGEARLFRPRDRTRIQGLPLRSLVHTIGEIARNAGTGADRLANPLLEDLLINQILSAWPVEGEDETTVGVGRSRAVARAVDYIEAHLADPLTVSLIAGAAGVGVRTLQNVFRTQMGRTPVAYVLERRLEHAHADLLASGNQIQVSQIAHRWGFGHMGEFSRRYRERYGCTPSETNRRAA